MHSLVLLIVSIIFIIWLVCLIIDHLKLIEPYNSLFKVILITAGIFAMLNAVIRVIL